LSTNPDNALTALDEWSRNAGLPGLDAQGIIDKHRQKAATMAASSSSMKANPVPLNEVALAEIMENAR